MNKKGFTLIELLATLVLMAIIIILIIPSLVNYSGKMRENSYNSKIIEVLESSKNYGEDNVNLLTSDCTSEESMIITIGFLISKGYVIGDRNNKSELTNPINNESMNNINICITYEYDQNSKIYAVKSKIMEE